MHTTNKKRSWFQRLEQLHPYETLLYLGMVGSGLIFMVDKSIRKDENSTVYHLLAFHGVDLADLIPAICDKFLKR